MQSENVFCDDWQSIPDLPAITERGLNLERPFRFSADLEPIFFEQLTSERRLLRYFKGQPARRFERIPGKRA